MKRLGSARGGVVQGIELEKKKTLRRDEAFHRVKNLKVTSSAEEKKDGRVHEYKLLNNDEQS